MVMLLILSTQDITGHLSPIIIATLDYAMADATNLKFVTQPMMEFVAVMVMDFIMYRLMDLQELVAAVPMVVYTEVLSVFREAD